MSELAITLSKAIRLLLAEDNIEAADLGLTYLRELEGTAFLWQFELRRKLNGTEQKEAK